MDVENEVPPQGTIFSFVFQPLVLTFDVNLCRGVVGSQAVGGHAGVAACVVLEGLRDHQCVQVPIPPDVDVRRVV